jgi:hypothetical protein
MQPSASAGSRARTLPATATVTATLMFFSAFVFRLQQLIG